MKDQAQITAAKSWEKRQGTRVFLRNLLSSTLALDVNFSDISSGRKTPIGELEERAKYGEEPEAISQLRVAVAKTINEVCYLKECDIVCGVPCAADKLFDLPRALAEGVSTDTGMLDITRCFRVEGKQASAKSVSLQTKWDLWDSCHIAYTGTAIEGKRVLLVDDKYQAGVTMQFWGGYLQRLGAAEVHGFAMVKTSRDSDNLS